MKNLFYSDLFWNTISEYSILLAWEKLYFKRVSRVKYCTLQNETGGINWSEPTGCSNASQCNDSWGPVLPHLLSVQRFLLNLVKFNMLSTRCGTCLLIRTMQHQPFSFQLCILWLKINVCIDFLHAYCKPSQYLPCVSKFCTGLRKNK